MGELRMSRNVNQNVNNAAAIQMVSGADVQRNLAEAERLLTQAAAAGAVLAVLPENFAFMGASDEAKLAIAETPGAGPIQEFLATQARKLSLWLLGGTLPLRTSAKTGESGAYASALLFNADGQQVSRFDKWHLFDVHIPERDERYEESRSTLAGDSLQVLDTPVGRLGLAVCYDLRFPELFRRMADEQVEVIALPSAFTAATGRAHWEVLLRARAIENLSYVIAPNQGGLHENGRETWGDSMIVDPWGQVLTRLPRGAGVVTAEINLATLRATRARFPALQHRKVKSP